MPGLPSYDELPEGKAWHLWPDEFGSLNLLTPERVKAGLACATDGRVFALNWDMGQPDPPLFGRRPFTHTVNWLEHEVGHDDDVSGWNTQSSSQWDGFRHIRHMRHGFYGGVADEDHGIHHWARRGIVGRAVLADVGRWRDAVGRPLAYDEPDPIDVSDITACLDAQGSEFAEGDILLLRTGWMSWYRGLDQATRQAMGVEFKSPGIRPGIESARALWNLHPAALAADNPAVELWPPGALVGPEKALELVLNPDTSPEVFLHFALLPLLGLPLGEMWDLDALADDCAADGRYHCLLTSAPLNLMAGVASPPNALAIK